jgi:hypothetical protein
MFHAWAWASPPRPYANIAASSPEANPHCQGPTQRKIMRDSTAGHSLIYPKPVVAATGPQTHLHRSSPWHHDGHTGCRPSCHCLCDCQSLQLHKDLRLYRESLFSHALMQLPPSCSATTCDCIHYHIYTINSMYACLTYVHVCEVPFTLFTI